MTSKNEITGQKQQTKPATDKYRDNYDAIFGKKKQVPEKEYKPVNDSTNR